MDAGASVHSTASAGSSAGSGVRGPRSKRCTLASSGSTRIAASSRLLLFDDALTLALHHDVHEAGQISHFLRLTPVWIALTHVSVDDHYCYVHYRDGDQWRKAAIGMPLTELMEKLPGAFVQVHRSHAVNVHAVSRVQRQGRALWIRLADDDVRLPLSRNRAAQVLPRLTDESRQREPGTAPASAQTS
jgi:DNA-binding LytR/AlgR family response regulator